MDEMPASDALEILEEQERRREVIVLLGLLVSLRLPNGKPCLDRVDRRILLEYILGESRRSIAAKVGKVVSNVQFRINAMSKKVLKCQGGHLVNWEGFLAHPQSTLEADVPEVQGWNYDNAQESFGGNYWGKQRNKTVWKTRVACRVPEYFQKCFGDNDTLCTFCGVKCTRR